MPRRQGTDRRGQIPDMVSIHVRQPEIEDRLLRGHWEGDFIKGANNVSVSGSRLESRHSECEGGAFVRTRAMRWKTSTLRLQRRWVHVAHGKGKRSGAKWLPPGRRVVSALGDFAGNRVWR